MIIERKIMLLTKKNLDHYVFCAQNCVYLYEKNKIFFIARVLKTVRFSIDSCQNFESKNSK